METVWEYTIETEAKRLIHCAHQMAVGFYRVNNFVVLPFVPKNTNSLIVTFPDLPYNKIPRFWEKVRKVNIHDMPLQVSPNILKPTLELLSKESIFKPKFINTQVNQFLAP